MAAKPVGRPREYNRQQLADAFERYISENAIPIIAEFSYLNDVPRELLYEWDEFPTLLKKCIAKKEAALEKSALMGTVNPTMAIFSLKQLGWKDRTELSGDKNAPVALNLIGSDVHG